MELNYSNLTDPNQNNLKYRKQFENFQKEKCKSKTMLNMENRIHYNRILNALTDNRSIDILNKSSLENVNKLNEKEFIIKYVNENRSNKSPDNMVLALAIALEIPLGETRRIQSLYDMVIEEMNIIFQVTNDLIRAPKRIDISVDGETVSIEANQNGVTASSNPFSLDAVPNLRRDLETGILDVVHWAGDNQSQMTPNRNFGDFNQGGFNTNNIGGSGEILFNDPARFSLPTNLPRRSNPVVIGRDGIPDNNELDFDLRVQSRSMGQMPREVSAQLRSGMSSQLAPLSGGDPGSGQMRARIRGVERGAFGRVTDYDREPEEAQMVSRMPIRIISPLVFPETPNNN